MAIIFNISEAIKDSSFNVLGLQIPMLLENQVEEFQKGSKISDVFVNKTLDGYSTSYHTTVSHGGFLKIWKLLSCTIGKIPMARLS